MSAHRRANSSKEKFALNRAAESLRQRINRSKEYAVVSETEKEQPKSSFESWIWSSEYDEALKLEKQLIRQYKDKDLEHALSGKVVSNEQGECYAISGSCTSDFKKATYEESRRVIISELKVLPGIGPVREQTLKQQGYLTVEDLETHPLWKKQAHEFIKMIDFCHGYNIKVYVDLILNHMADFVETETQHIGTNGHIFGKYNYTQLNNENDCYAYDDFYHFEPSGNKQISMEDYCKLESVWHLEHYDLVHLPKLNLDSSHVISILHKYVKYLLSLGVDGFRIDAAKHLKVRAVEKIFAGLKTLDGLSPFSYQEYYISAPMGIDIYSFMKKYFQIGYVTSFKYGEFLSDAINNKSNNFINNN